jgi:hypothetical protein
MSGLKKNQLKQRNKEMSVLPEGVIGQGIGYLSDHELITGVAVETLGFDSNPIDDNVLDLNDYPAVTKIDNSTVSADETLKIIKAIATDALNKDLIEQKEALAVIRWFAKKVTV